MSEHAARQALQRMNGREVFVDPMYVDNLTGDLRQMATANTETEEKKFEARRAELCAAYGMEGTPQRKPFAFANGVAIVPVHGTLINRFGYSWGYVTGYNFLRQQVALAGQDPEVKAIVYDVNSYGGEAAGCFECAADLTRLANGKPTIAVVDSAAYSAAYAISVAADKIVCTPSGGVGSVGVVAMHVDYSKMLSDVGIKVTFIHAGKHKVDGNPYEALDPAVKAEIQKQIDKSYSAFVGVVAEGRGLEDKAVRATEARTYRADDALSIGFIDAIESPNVAIQAFIDELSGSKLQSQPQEPQMADADNKPGAADQAAQQAAAIAAAVKADRERTSGIMNCEEAKGRTALANHFALNTSMTVDEAKAALKVAPSEAAATVPAVTTTAAAPAATVKPENAFAAAMDQTQNPNVGADTAGGNGDDADKKATAELLGAFSSASGLDLKLR